LNTPGEECLLLREEKKKGNARVGRREGRTGSKAEITKRHSHWPEKLKKKWPKTQGYRWVHWEKIKQNEQVSDRDRSRGQTAGNDELQFPEG